MIFLDGVCTGVEFEPCFPAVKGQACNMTCRIPDFTQGIEFKCNGSSRGICSIFVCPNMIKEGTDTLLLQIPSISYTTDNCEWNCAYGGTTSSNSNLVIFSKYIRLTIQNPQALLVLQIVTEKMFKNLQYI